MSALTASVAEAAREIGVSEWMVRQLVARGDLAKIPHLGKRIRIARVELARFAAEGVKSNPLVEVERGGAA